MKRARSSKATTRLRRQKAKLDTNIARVKRKIKGLAKQLRTQEGILSKRVARRRKMM